MNLKVSERQRDAQLERTLLWRSCEWPLESQDEADTTTSTGPSPSLPPLPHPTSKAASVVFYSAPRLLNRLLNRLDKSAISTLVLCPVASVSYASGLSDLPVFATSLAATVSLSFWLRSTTKELADLGVRTGSDTAGYGHAVFGNPIEGVVVAVLALRGESFLLRAFLAGSVLKSLFLVSGFGLFAGGIKHPEQEFQHTAYFKALHIVSAGSLILPYNLLPSNLKIIAEHLCGNNSATLTGLICAMLIYAYGRAATGKLFHSDELPMEYAGKGTDKPTSYKNVELPTVLPLSVRAQDKGNPSYAAVLRSFSTFALLCAAGMLLVAILIGSMGGALSFMRISPLFAGLILLPASCSLSEISTVIRVARKERDVHDVIDVSSVSCLHTSMVLAPCAIVLSWFAGQPFSLLPPESERLQCAVPFATVATFIYLMRDRRSNWFIGITLLASYAVVGMTAVFA